MVNTLAQTNTKIAGDALTKDAGAEVLALRKKADNDNALSQNFGDRQNRGNAKRKVSDKPSTSSNVVPFRPKPRPDDGSAGGVTTSVATNKTETDPSKIVGSGFYKPSGIPTPANDNQVSGVQKNPKETPDQNGQVNKSNVVVGAFGRKEQPVVNENDLGDAGKNVGAGIRDSLENLAVVKKPGENKGEEGEKGLGANNDNDSLGDSEIDRLNQQLESSQLEIESQRDSQKGEDEAFLNKVRNELAKEKIDLTDDEIRNLIGSNFKVKFPYIMFSVCVMFEIGTLLLALVSLVLSFILLPMGLIIGAISAISSAVMSLIVFAWTYYFVHNASDFVKKIPMMKRFLIRMMFKRGWIMLAKLIPILGSFLPIQSFMVYMTYENMKKVALKVEKIVRS